MIAPRQPVEFIDLIVTAAGWGSRTSHADRLQRPDDLWRSLLTALFHRQRRRTDRCCRPCVRASRLVSIVWWTTPLSDLEAIQPVAGNSKPHQSGASINAESSLVVDLVRLVDIPGDADAPAARILAADGWCRGGGHTRAVGLSDYRWRHSPMRLSPYFAAESC
ncbi:hypothetical protein DSL92_01745 [Billgrantia gudaonensis]|uniref:Uncharacterized protein n=1 Tax=Billgrantia gudaonensis TaxID=376427 RepID=A0A432JK85_9GAMM|nr:hypothetical protein DSL92_01745 [Halomonas gudaonensis]